MWTVIRKNAIWIVGVVVLFILIVVFIPRGNQNQMMSDSETSEAATPGKTSAKELFAQAQNMVKNGNLQEAKALYRRIIQEDPNFEHVAVIEKDLENINMQILFSNRVSPESVLHEVVSGDSLGKLAKQYGTTIALIKRSNDLKTDVIRLGQKLRIWTGKFNILVDKSQNVLMLRNGDEIFKVYQVSTGKEASTPVGEFTIVSKLEHPVWFHKGVVVPPDSPDNLLGTRWMGFDMQGYGIHGTTEPEKIGQQVTAGCVRMRNEEVEELFSFIPMGTKVSIVE